MAADIVIASVFAAQLGLVAFSFNFAYRATGFANFAHVEYATLGAYIAYQVQGHVPLSVSIVSGALGGAMLAVVTNTMVFQPLRDASTGTKMIASAGVGMILRVLVQYIWGIQPLSFSYRTAVYRISNTYISFIQCTTVGAAVVVAGVFAVFLRYTPLGRQIRAVTDNRALAEVRGIRSRLIYQVVWFLAGAVAGLTGVLVALNGFVEAGIGTSLLLPMFAAALVGGVGSPYGGLLGAVLVSAVGNALVLTNFGALVGTSPHFLGSQYKSVAAFAVVVLILLVKPTGIFGLARLRV